MSESRPLELKSDEPAESSSNHRHDDACPVCNTEPIRYGTSESGNAKIRRYCPDCEAYHWELVAQQNDHDTVLDYGGAA